MKTRLIPMLLALAVLLALTAPGLMAAGTDPLRDLVEAVAYWQEQAAAAARQVAMWEGAVEALRGAVEALRGAAEEGEGEG